MRKSIQFLSLLSLLLILGCQDHQRHTYTENDINIIPKPSELELRPGSFTFNNATRFELGGLGKEEWVRPLAHKFRTAAGWDLKIVESAPTNYVKLVEERQFGEEAYRLQVEREGVIISAKGLPGFLYGLESLRQLLPKEIESNERVVDVSWEIPNVTINDAPRFKWRGLMLDVSRHFFGKEYVKKTIDRLVMLKMNTLHLHLVDDQGWRIEIKKYPKLTQIGAFRVNREDQHWNVRDTPRSGEDATYGGFYTQEDIREIVAYATARGITVVPEIEMPAHVMSALAAYPELSCFENPIRVPPGGVWPITEIYCAGKEGTFEFLEDVLLEVMDLFPSQYIHVGGDEATKNNWKICPHCQKRIKDEGLKNVEELQSYFMKRIERFVSGKGRTLIGWDEILEGGLPSGATVMSWRGMEGGLEASKAGHDVIMTPTEYCYFDYYQGDQDREPLAFPAYVPLRKVYDFEPLAKGMDPSQENHILGGQANLWSEYIPTESHSEYMLFPRVSAMAEVLWSLREDRDWNDFSRRIQSAFGRYRLLGINYSKSAYQLTAEANSKDGKLNISLKNEFPDPTIRYSMNGDDLSKEGMPYTGPITVTGTSTLSAALFKEGRQVGEPFKKHFEYHKALDKTPEYTDLYHENYPGEDKQVLVNVLRGSKDFHDGQWQGWLVKDMEVIIDLKAEEEVQKVVVGSIENQGAGIYFPKGMEVWTSLDGKDFDSVGQIEREYQANGIPELRNFEMGFEKRPARYIKVKMKNLEHAPSGGDAWLFIDEVLVQ
ncbi:MAG: family 20 glycosylhydrolase [Sediminicola sp.]